MKRIPRQLLREVRLVQQAFHGQGHGLGIIRWDQERIALVGPASIGDTHDRCADDTQPAGLLAQTLFGKVEGPCTQGRGRFPKVNPSARHLGGQYW